MLSFLVIHARHSRRPSRSRVNFASSFATFNRPVPILSGRSWPSLPMFPFQLSTVDCQPPVTFHGSRKDSNPFLSPSCALFCTHQNSSCLFSCGCALFAKNHPGWGMATSVNSAFSVASALIPIPCFSRGHGTRITHYRPAWQLATRHSPLHQKGAALLTDRLLVRGGSPHGVVPVR